jgi:hypothetical protein
MEINSNINDENHLKNNQRKVYQEMIKLVVTHQDKNHHPSKLYMIAG